MSWSEKRALSFLSAQVVCSLSSLVTPPLHSWVQEDDQGLGAEGGDEEDGLWVTMGSVVRVGASEMGGTP